MSKQTPEQKEIESLRAHNAELLDDLKKAKAKSKEAAQQLEALTADRDQAKAELRKLTLDIPVNQMLERVTALPEHFLTEFRSAGYEFALDGADVVIVDKDGKPAMMGEETRTPSGLEIAMREASFTESDISDLVAEKWKPEHERSHHVKNFEAMVFGSRGSGGGAIGTNGGAGGGQPIPKQAEPNRLTTGLQ